MCDKFGQGLQDDQAIGMLSFLIDVSSTSTR